LYVASGALYVRNVFKKEAKAAMTEMITYIREQFVVTLKKIDWMDDTTKKHALEKAKAIHLHMAYPDELLDDQKLEHYYKNVRLGLVLVRATDFFLICSSILTVRIIWGACLICLFSVMK
jgi:predicted metalloendopeptidase